MRDKTYGRTYADVMEKTNNSLSQATDPLCLRPGEAERLLAGAPWRRFAVIGDSLSAGVGDAVPGYGSAGWGDRVADALRGAAPSLEYVNTGKIGASTRAVLETQVDDVLAFGPDLLHLPCGPNDILVRTPDFRVIEADMVSLYERASATRALLTTYTLGRAFQVPAFPDWRTRIGTLNAITRKVAATYDANVVDFYDHPVNDRPDLVSADGIHFSAVGQAVMAAEYVRHLGARC